MLRRMMPTDYLIDRLFLGGSLVFCSAVIVQLLQVTMPLPEHLRTALWSAAIAIPCLVATLGVYSAHERFAVRYRTGYTDIMVYVGVLGTAVCASAVFRHLSGHITIGFVAMGFIALLLAILDLRYHKRHNRPPGDAADPAGSNPS